MAINKVVFGNEVKMDLTNDTVSADNLLEGETAHDRSGSPVVGTAKQGHSILNKLGTLLTQRSKLKFGGMLRTTDDATNGVTVVSDEAEEIDWSVWNAMTEAQRTAYSAGKKLDIINVPSVSGSIPVELIKTLWTNSDPTATFTPQNITLASDDYDFLYVVCRMSTEINREISSLIEAENTGFIATTFATTGGINMYQRTIQYTSKTVLWITDAYKITNGTYGGVDNTIIVPTAIYGIKSSVNVDMSALVANVSTSASKCMLSDGETSVEDALNTLKGFSLVTETDSIATNGVVNVNLSNVDISKVVEFGIMASYSGSFAYASFNTFPVISSIRFRLYHCINSASVGTVQCLIYYSSGYYMEIASQVNEAIKVRLYARYI